MHATTDHFKLVLSLQLYDGLGVYDSNTRHLLIWKGEAVS